MWRGLPDCWRGRAPSSQRAAHKALVVSLVMRDKNVVERVAGMLGSKVYEHKRLTRGKRCYQTMVSTKKAAGLRMTVYSFMGERRPERLLDAVAEDRANEYAGTHLALASQLATDEEDGPEASLLRRPSSEESIREQPPARCAALGRGDASEARKSYDAGVTAPSRLGSYRTLGELRRGRIGVLYHARDEFRGRDVTIQILLPAQASDPDMKQLLEREAKVLARMTHPNIVTVFEFGYHTDGSPYIVMEQLKGRTLDHTLRHPSPMSIQRKVSIISQVLDGLDHAHRAGIVHRDIKPGNIFVQDNGPVKIIDFGVAGLIAHTMTGTGSIAGTADYMSPEQVKGSKVDGRSDVFSVGCTLYEMLASRPPFHSDKVMAIFYKITHEDANCDLIPGGPEYDALLPILKKSLAKGLDDRYQDASSMARELRQVMAKLLDRAN
jgi:hypothetical protein